MAKQHDREDMLSIAVTDALYDTGEVDEDRGVDGADWVGTDYFMADRRVVRVVPIDSDWTAGVEVYVFGNARSMVVERSAKFVGLPPSALARAVVAVAS